MPASASDPSVRADPPPAPQHGLEESAASAPQDWACALAFALDRARGDDAARPVLLAATADWRRERGGLSARGLIALGFDPGQLILVKAAREADALWALEEALKSGAVAGGIATVERADF